MEHKNYLNNSKKPGLKPWQNNIHKKYTNPLPINEKKSKPLRINSMTKQSRVASGSYNYGINGINYTRKREFEKYDTQMEESKALKEYPESYKVSKAKARNVNYEEFTDDLLEDDSFYKAKVYALTK